MSKNHNAILNWNDDGARYARGFFIGSEDTTGAHIRADDGWPYSIYKRGNQPGVGDAVLCHGIQSRADAEILLALLIARAKDLEDVIQVVSQGCSFYVRRK